MKRPPLKYKDLKLRQNYNSIERRYFLFKAIQSNCLIPFEERLTITQKINTFKKFSKSRALNRCLITNNGRSVYRPFNLNRNIFRKLVTNTDLIGVKKSS